MEDRKDIEPIIPVTGRPKTSFAGKLLKTLAIFGIGSGLTAGCEAISTNSQNKIDTTNSIPPKVNVENLPTSNIETSIPASVPTDEGENVVQDSPPYPTTSDNFIFTNTKTNEEKTKYIKEVAPVDYEKEVALYKAEIERMGQRVEDFEFVPSVLEGKSWATVPKNKKTGRMLIPIIEGKIQRSLDLWKYLDRTDDFFDLVEVNMDNPILIADKTGWHVITNSQHSKWYDAEHDQIKNVEIAPTPTVEKQEIKINSAFPLKDIAKGIEHPENYSPVTLEDIPSGRLLEAVKAQSEKNPPFTEKAIPRNRVFFVPTEAYIQWHDVNIEVEIAAVKSIPEDSDPEVRPIKIESYHPFIDNELLTKEFGWEEKYLNFFNYKWIVVWAYLNPDNNVTYGFTLTDMGLLLQANNDCLYGVTDIYGNKVTEGGYDPALATTVRIGDIPTDIKEVKEISNINLIVSHLYEKMPELSPEPYLDQWGKTGQMPEELQYALFGWTDVGFCWK